MLSTHNHVHYVFDDYVVNLLTQVFKLNFELKLIENIFKIFFLFFQFIDENDNGGGSCERVGFNKIIQLENLFILH